MSVLELHRKVRIVRRYQQILNVLVKHGFGYVLDKLGLEEYISTGKRLVGLETRPPKAREPLPVKLRHVMEELGPTFIKMGQILSMRPDLLPPNFLNEFKKLQDQAKRVPLEEINETVLEELGELPANLFKEFSQTARASASMAQVHDAVLPDGSKVVIKIQRPDIKNQVEADVEILRNLAGILESRVPESRIYQPMKIVDEFSRTIHRELDFSIEGRNTEIIAKNFKDREKFYAPRVYWEFTTDRVLTIEWIEGTNFTDIELIKKTIDYPSQLAKEITEEVLNQVLLEGTFHGDLHGGNIILTPQGHVTFVDFGMVGRLETRTRDELARILLAVMNKDTESIISSLISLGVADEEINERSLERDVTEFLDFYIDRPLKDISLAKAFNELLGTCARHHLRTPPDFYLLGRTLLVLEGLSRSLDPEFHAAEVIQPIAKEIISTLYSPHRMAKRTTRILFELANLIMTIPRRLNTVLSKAEKGTLKIEFEHLGLEKLVSILDRASNRLSVSLVVAALVISSSLIMHAQQGPLLFGFPILGIIGFVIAAFLGLVLVLSIIRSGKI